MKMPVKRIGWAADTHLDHATPAMREEFYEQLLDADLDGVVLGGDIGTSENCFNFLAKIDNRVGVRTKIFYLLGNHDCWGSSIAQMKKVAGQLQIDFAYLPMQDVIHLGGTTVMLGADLWYDINAGAGRNSSVRLNDFHSIGEFIGKTSFVRQQVIQNLVRQDVSSLARKLDVAADMLDELARHSLTEQKKIILFVHVPPFASAAFHEGSVSDYEHLPYFCCVEAGRLLSDFVHLYPDIKIDVYAGHTHGAGIYQHNENLTVQTFHAEYGLPRLQHVIEL